MSPASARMAANTFWIWPSSTRWTEAGTEAWSAEPHCVLIEAGRDQLAVTPYGPGADDEPFALEAEGPDGTTGPAAFVVTPAG